MLFTALGHAFTAYRTVRLTIYYIAYWIVHPVGIVAAMFLFWRNSSIPGGHDNLGFLFPLFGYGLFVLPVVRIIRNLTYMPPAERKPELPKEKQLPAPARVSLMVSPGTLEASSREPEMWGQLDPLLQRLGEPPG